MTKNDCADLLFVYGTLMRGFENPMAKLLARQSDDLGDAQCRGRLYRIRHYPGLVLSSDTSEIVHGELFRMRQPAELLGELDRYEACGEGFAPPTEYLRQIVQVERAGGETLDAWTYVYNWPVDEARRIANGRFVTT